MWNDDQRGEKIAGREHQDCTLARDRELSEQQRRREQVVDQQRHLNGWNKRMYRRKLHPGERQHDQERDEQGQDDREREPTLSLGWRQDS